MKITADYIHTDLHGIPDFGVPYYRPGRRASAARQFTTTAGGPFPNFGANRNKFYGFVNRDFFQVQQDIGTINTEIHVTPDLIVSDKTRVSQSLNNYIGTMPESPIVDQSQLLAVRRSPPIRRAAIRSPTCVANQSEATYKFDTGAFKHTLLGGVESRRETSSIDKYTGLSSEGPAIPSPAADR